MSTSWHALPSEEVLSRLESDPDGLGEADAQTRLARYGPNRLVPPRPVSALRILADQFASVVILLLLAAAIVALLIGDVLESLAIAAVLVLNTTLGFVIELRARRAMEALLRYDVPQATVVRNGEPTRVTADQIVPGDIIALDSGDAVPADARLLTAAEVRTVEASLTGESTPVEKTLPPVDESSPLADRSSMLYVGTTLASGHARAVVVATGRDTELGKIGQMLSAIEETETPLERRLDLLGRKLVWWTLAITAAVVALGSVRGAPVGRMIETGLALAIAAVPEGLPAVATIALAVGLTRMARRNALVRRLSAVEALGSTTVVCTDKTGTLTAGEMTVTLVRGADFELEVSGAGFRPEGEILSEGEPAELSESRPAGRLLRAAVLTNRASLDPDSGGVTGDPTDAALLVLGLKGGLDPDELETQYPRTGELPFSSERRMSASYHEFSDDDDGMVLVKGAPGAVLDLCNRVTGADADRSLEPAVTKELEAVNEEWAARGLRVIALAEGQGKPDRENDLGGLTFLGLVGITDPPAAGVEETVARFREAGIRTVMITGDQRATAEAIGTTLGMLGHGQSTLDGRELASLGDAELAAAVPDVAVYSRVSPEDKLRVVRALQEAGQVVAMLGDGVNDAAALKKADVGVAMGIRGTDVAKQTASVVLQDDRFPTIAVAVEEGRVIFDNIRKFVFYLFSCNLAEILVLLGGSLAGLPLPLLPLQILWLNLVTDTFPALALALEPGEPGAMKKPPRDPGAPILSRGLLRAMLFHASLITLSTLAAFVWALETGRSGQALTVSFMTLALAQLFHLGNARAHGPVITPRRVFSNRWAVAAVPLVIALQLVALYWPPLARVLETAALGWPELLAVTVASLTPAVVGQVVEIVQERRRAPGAGRPTP